MFKLFGKTQKKVEEGIKKAEVTLDKAEGTFAHIDGVAKEMKDALAGIKILVTVSTIGVLLGIAVDVASMIVNGRTVKIIKT